MKKILFFLASVCCIYSCKNANETPLGQAYSINGIAKNIRNGEVYIQILNCTTPKPDTIKVVDGKFTYTGKCQSPELAIMLVSSKNTLTSNHNTALFFTEPGANINIVIDSSAKDKILITGSKVNDEFKQFRQNSLVKIEDKERKAFENVNPMNINDAKVMDSLMKLAQSIDQEKKQAVIDYISTHKNTVVGVAYAYLISTQDADIKFIQSAYDATDETVKKTFYAEEIKKKIDAVSKTETGATAIDFTSTNAEGKPVKLSDFYKDKKFVLLDFWASWCGPCRKENPNVVKAYNQFHSKGFDVLGISLDEDKNEWLDAVNKDKLTWTQVSDLKGWDSEVARLYNISAIPTNFLIDGNGKILASNLRGEALAAKLASLLK